MAELKTNYKNYTWTGKKKFRLTNNTDGTVSLEDVTPYIQTGDTMNAAVINETNSAINATNREVNAHATKLEAIGTDGSITAEGHASPIGTVKDIAINKTVTMATGTSFNTNTLETVTLEKGTWLVEAAVQFPALGAADKQIGFMLHDLASGSYTEESYMHSVTQYVAYSGNTRLHLDAVFKIEASTATIALYAFQNSGSSKSGTCFLRAVRIA